MSKPLPLNIVLLSIVITLAGCESTGTIQGVSEGRGVQFEYQQRFFDNDGALKITMPDGETFTGKFVQKSTSTSGNEWEIGESSGDDSFILKDSNTVSSQADAVLLGNRGNSMTCKFQLSDPSFGIDGGGIGNCQTSTNTPISFAF